MPNVANARNVEQGRFPAKCTLRMHCTQRKYCTHDTIDACVKFNAAHSTLRNTNAGKRPMQALWSLDNFLTFVRAIQRNC